jgi:membrane fusion protein
VTGQLFRHEVVEQQGDRLWTGFSGLKPVPMLLLTLLLLSLTVAAGWFLASGEYRRKEVVTGIIVTDKGAVKVRAPSSGVVGDVLFSQGEWVGKGDSLLEIRSGRGATDDGVITEKLIIENKQQIGILHSLADKQKRIFPLRLKQLEAELESLEIKKRQLLSLLKNKKAVNALMTSKLERLDGLLGYRHVSLADFEKVRMEALQHQNSVYQTKMELENSKRLIEKTRHEKQLYQMEFRQQLADLETQLSELRKQNYQLQGEQLSYVVSPVSGTISVVYPQQGQYVIEQQPLFSVLQDDSLIEAELYVPSRAAGFLEKGLQVRLSFDAFPYQKFGTLTASVREISQSVLMPEDAQASKGMNEPFYRVTASLEQSFISAYGERIKFRPGMQLKASIVLESRSLIEWVLEPFFVQREIL